MYDIAIIGGGPAGLSAAVNARARNKTVLVVTNSPAESPLYKAKKVNNYLGMPNMTGAQMLDAFVAHAEAAGAELRTGKVLSILPMGDSFYLNIGSDVAEAKAVILATGVARGAKYPGEAELLGAGVSYCATCDGMLYRGKKVAVIGLSSDAQHEADFLRSLNCEVLYFDKPQKFEIKGAGKVEALAANGAVYPVDGVFILRPTLAPTDLLPSLAMEGGYIAVDRQMHTNIPGVFAAGDCIGAPLQVANAVGDGLTAGQRAAESVK
jgi:thioredoxin reductase (NADPH)